MYTRDEILLLAEDYDRSTYGDLRRNHKMESFYFQLSHLLDQEPNPDKALEQFIKSVYDRFFIMENMKVFFGPYEDLPLYVNDQGFSLVVQWRFKINK